MIRRLLVLCLTIVMVLVTLPNQTVYARTTDEWLDYCVGYEKEDSSTTKYQECSKFYNDAIGDAQNDLNELRDKYNNLKGDLEAAQKELNNVQAQMDALQPEINTISASVKELEESIKQLEEQITEKEVEVEKLETQVLGRMASMQGSMHFNPFLEFILGASSFDEMLRRGYGLDALMGSDKLARDDLKEIIDSLALDKAKLDEDKVILDGELSKLLKKKRELQVLKDFQADIVEKTNEQIESTLANLKETQKYYNDLIDGSDLSALPSSEGFISPIPGARVSAGVWRYPASFGGGIHLGIDYAVSKGTQIYAPANGVVLVSSDGCGDGWYGNPCGSQNGGEIYGGNQIYLIVAAGGSIYGVIFCHLLKNTLAVEPGDIVFQGDPIAQVGSSGNSTGPHSHVELFYLGDGEVEDIPYYLNKGYTLSFNCGWGSKALKRLCENGVGAPCRLDPRNYFGK